MDFGLKEKDSLLVRSYSCNRYTNQTKHVCKMVLEYGQIFVQKSQIGTYNLEWFKSRPRVFRVRKRHLIATVFRKHRMRHIFSFNPKNKVTITFNEVLEFVFVAEFGTKNVIFVTIVTKRPYKLLIIKWIFRVEKSPWRVRGLLHRKINRCFSSGQLRTSSLKISGLRWFLFWAYPLQFGKIWLYLNHIWTTRGSRLGKIYAKVQNFTSFYMFLQNCPQSLAFWASRRSWVLF